MKSLDRFFKLFDRKVDSEVHPFMKFFKKNFIIFSSLFIAALFVTLVVWVYYSRSDVLSQIVTEDLMTINTVLNQIEKECNILQIQGDAIAIDFLNVEKFAGSVVGGMSLAYPEKWAGPYVTENPSLEGIFYEFVKAKDGYFIVPGRGVKLPNGVVMGKNFVIKNTIAVGPQLEEGGKLFYKGTAYGLKITFTVGKWDSPFKVSDPHVKKADTSLEEFNEALPFAHNVPLTLSA